MLSETDRKTLRTRLEDLAGPESESYHPYLGGFLEPHRSYNASDADHMENKLDAVKDFSLGLMKLLLRKGVITVDEASALFP